MGRVKLQIKRIENTTNRQVTFSKRRNGLIKKAYELSVLCDVDVALLMFSPSGRLTVFSGNNKSIDDVLARYVNLPEHERGRLPKQEILQRYLSKMMMTQSDTMKNQVSSSGTPVNTNLQHEEFQQQILKYRSRIEELEKQLSILEGDASRIKTLREADHWEQLLQQTLKHVYKRKKVMEKKHNSPLAHLPSTSQGHITPEAANASGFVTESPNKILDWQPQREPQVQILHCLDSNGLLLSDRLTQDVADQMVQPPSSSLLQGQNMNLINDRHQSMTNCFHENSNNIVRGPDQFEQGADHVNMSSWAEFYPTGDGTVDEAAQSRERALLELYLSQFAPQILTLPTHHPP